MIAKIKVGSKVSFVIHSASGRVITYTGVVVEQSSDGSISQVETESGSVWEATEHLRLMEEHG